MAGERERSIDVRTCSLLLKTRTLAAENRRSCARGNAEDRAIAARIWMSFSAAFQRLSFRLAREICRG
ncbi:MAG: hypothetical protein LC790_18605 [Actinobacteria bacterium]|nr:hypothetical protein [Actinomycetota bacterium]